MKGFRLAIAFIILAFAFSGCGEKPSDITDNTPQEYENNLSETKIINSQAISDKIAGYTEITSYTGDCDGDGADERIVLSTAAERDSKGEFLWNDGQNWALYVVDLSGDSYILYDGYVQAGTVHFDVSDYYMKDGAKPVITVTVSTGAGLMIKNYTFQKDKGGYAESIVYDTQAVAEGGINKRFTSIPDIVK